MKIVEQEGLLLEMLDEVVTRGHHGMTMINDIMLIGLRECKEELHLHQLVKMVKGKDPGQDQHQGQGREQRMMETDTHPIMKDHGV